jgi:tellurite methyltransferase
MEFPFIPSFPKLVRMSCDDHLTFLTREQAFAELDGLKMIGFDEQDTNGHTAEGTAKHWHIYHIIARKPF